MRIDQHTVLYAVIGHPLGHTLSPVMHNRAFEATGENAVYMAFETDRLADALNGMRALGIRGCSVTLPFKTAVMPLLDDIDPLARAIGAVNTIVNRGGRLAGYNTDAAGALAAVREVMEPSGHRVVILGAGGAARAAGFALKEAGASLTIANRTPEKGKALALALNATFAPIDDLRGLPADLLIQATPVGMHPRQERCPLDEALIQAPVVMELIYNPRETRLLEIARRKGAAVIPGLRMFIHQGAAQFRLWTGKEPPLEAMEAAVLAALEHP